MRFRFVHAADLHLDTPFSGIGSAADPRVSEGLPEASLAAFDALVELTIREEASFLLLAGDLYDGARRGLRAQMRFLSGVSRLAGQGVQVLAVHGNHDPLDEGWSAVRDWPAGVTFFGADEPSAVAIERGGVRLATVHGVSFASGEERRNLARMFRRGAGPGLHIGLLHCNVGGDAEHGPYAPCSPDDLAEAGMDYWALGHVHRRRTVIPGRPWAVYPGNVQARSPHPGEQGAKGAVVVEADTAGGVLGEPRFVALDRVRFVPLELNVSGARDVASVLRAASAALTAAQEAHAGRGLVVRVRFSGEAAWAADLERECASGEVLRHLREDCSGCDPFVWIDSVECAASPGFERERLRGRGDFAGELIAQSDLLRTSPGLLAELGKQLDDELRGPLRVASPLRLDTADPAAVLAEAERRCLRLMSGAGGNRP